MSLVLKDRVKETSTTSGTGALTLAGAVAGYQSFSVIGNGNDTYYTIYDPYNNTWEVGIGTYSSTGPTLTRNTVLSSSNSGNLVSFSNRAKTVFCVYPADSSVYASGNTIVANNGAQLPISTGVSGLGAGVANFLSVPSSENLATALTDKTGTDANVFANTPTLISPILGTPQSGTLTNCTGLPVATGISGLGTGVSTALAVNTGSSGAVVVNGGTLGTPSSGTVTNLTGTASININGTVGATTPAAGIFTDVRVGSNATIVSGARVQVTPSGDFTAGIAIGSTSAATTWSRLDFKNFNVGTANFIFADQTGQIGIRTEGAYPITFWTNGANERLRIDSSGNVLVTNPALLGYGTGAGGTVNQGATSGKGTLVTLNKPCGQITMNNAALAGGATIAFVLNNSLITTSDNIILSSAFATGFNYTVALQNIVPGACGIRVTNLTGGSLSEALLINFAIIKGATA